MPVTVGAPGRAGRVTSRAHPDPLGTLPQHSRRFPRACGEKLLYTGGQAYTPPSTTLEIWRACAQNASARPLATAARDVPVTTA